MRLIPRSSLAWLLGLPFLLNPAFSTEPVPPALFHCIDPNLEVTIWAKSPLFYNPTNIDIDQHGRIWVAEGVNYRMHFNRRPEGDRIMVLEDTDGDGVANKSWPFVQEKFLRAPMGVAVIGNKVVVSMTPDLIVYTDHDGDAVFDASKGDTREVLLTGFTGRAHDHSLHSVTEGPDGKWYFSVGNCGAKFTDRDGKTWRIGAKQNISWWPKDPEWKDPDPNEWGGQPSDDGKVYVGGFIARMNSDGTGVEILAHNLRNSYENCVTSYGDIFAADNDDSPACRTFAVLEGGNYGFASRDGSRPWQADRRPGQDIKTATWRQEDPGVAPAGDIYGAGSPTGIVFYENGALGEQHEGTLLLCEPARNTIFGYKPERDGWSWKLERFDFLTTNKEQKFTGIDSNSSTRADDTKTLFRPSDIAVGPDGALYIADWLDPRVGGHADHDESTSGTIYRVAPKGFKSVVPKIDLESMEGVVEALKSPAVHVRALGMAKWRANPPSNIALEIPAQTQGNLLDFMAARSFSADTGKTMRAERYEGTDPNKHANVSALMNKMDPNDKASLEIFTRLNEGNMSQFLQGLLKTIDPAEILKNPDKLPEPIDKDPLQWSDIWAAVLWRLHPPQSIPAFKTRALASALSEKHRKDALTAIAFNDTKEAAEAMLEIAVALAPASDEAAPSAYAPPPAGRLIFDTALWWLLNKKDSAWKDHGVAAALKEKGLYDPETIQLTAMTLPEAAPATFSIADALALTGDATRGEAVSQRCLMCHRIGSQGVDFGPELTGWGKTQPTETILRAIIEPAADIAHGFHGTEIQTTDGLTIHGLVINDADPLIIQSMGGQTQTVPRRRIKEKKDLRRGLMLSAAELGLTAQDAADIAAFLKK